MRRALQTASRARRRALHSASGPHHLFLDCDDCLYSNEWRTADKISESISATALRMTGVGASHAHALYTAHGTTLKGLLAEGHLRDAADIEHFLTAAHDIDLSCIEPDAALAAVLARLQVPTWVFTASIAEHAERCMDRLGLVGAFSPLGIIDTRGCGFETKHSAASFEAAMAIAGVTEPSSCTLCDDSEKNIAAAKAAGWRGVLVGGTDRRGQPIYCPEADFVVPTLHALPDVLPELFAR